MQFKKLCIFYYVFKRMVTDFADKKSAASAKIRMHPQIIYEKNNE